MHIAIISEKYTPDIGGLAVSVQRLAGLLSAYGHTVEVIAPSVSLEPGKLTIEDMPGIRVTRFGARRRTDDTLVDWFDLVTKRHSTDAFDLIHGFFLTQAGFMAAYTGQYLYIPSVVSARGNDLDRSIFDPSKSAHIFFGLQNANAITANTHELARKVKALVPGRQAVYIPNGVDTALFRPQPAKIELIEELGVEGRHILGFVGEARAKKGLADLLLAFRQIASNKKASLLLIGGVRSGDDKELLRVFKRQNPKLSIKTLPYISSDALPDYYNLLDILILPSLRDGLPNALLEGMACECAIIATNAGGIPDAITHQENGYLTSPGEPQELAQAITTLLEDETKRDQLGKNARDTVLRRFSLEQELEKNLLLYEQLLR